MTVVNGVRTALILAPHPDDEVLGCGGTMARLIAQGCEVHVAIVTRGRPPYFSDEQTRRVKEEARAAQASLGVQNLHHLEFPAAALDGVPHQDLNRAIGDLVRDVSPDILFLPFIGDIHVDHQLIFTSGMVAARPRSPDFPAKVLAYETLSETNWNAPYVSSGFAPNLFIDISDHLEAKLAAFRCYASQVQEFPNERSVEAIEALARLRGATVHRRAAEAFVLLRELA
jgi:LmbE family N-acetylglucosaminyl deacetylase